MVLTAGDLLTPQLIKDIGYEVPCQWQRFFKWRSPTEIPDERRAPNFGGMEKQLRLTHLWTPGSHRMDSMRWAGPGEVALMTLSSSLPPTVRRCFKTTGTWRATSMRRNCFNQLLISWSVDWTSRFTLTHLRRKNNSVLVFLPRTAAAVRPQHSVTWRVLVPWNAAILWSRGRCASISIIRRPADTLASFRYLLGLVKLAVIKCPSHEVKRQKIFFFHLQLKPNKELQAFRKKWL